MFRHIAGLWAQLLSSHTKQRCSSTVYTTNDLCVQLCSQESLQLMATTHSFTALLFSFILLLFTSLSFQGLTPWWPSGSSCKRRCIQTAHPAVNPLCSPRLPNRTLPQLLRPQGNYTSLQSADKLLVSEDFRPKPFLRQCLGPLDAAHWSPSMANDAQNPTTSLSITEGRRIM